MDIMQESQKFINNVRGFWTTAFIAFPILLGSALFSLYDPQGTLFSSPWVQSLQINLSWNLDGLSMLFISLICGIGFLVQLYATSYMHDKPNRMSFHFYLTAFMLSMLGLVLSDDLILLFIFWELTTIISYLLIGFNHDLEKSRKNALQALLITGIGGLSLLAGVILLGEVANTYSLSEIIEKRETLFSHHLFTHSLILILLGAFTKSAQFPFHFWLPGAMAAPTPVSAYLHSATMVKAGVYLLARVSPIYAQSDFWLISLCCVGGITAVWAAFMALKQTDLKLILAYTTIAVLGKIIFLLAFNTNYATIAALQLILAHAFYKAGLFMVIGNIDKSTGTREINQLSGLKSVLPLTFLGAAFAALSAAGVIPFLGFMSKEYVYKAGLDINKYSTLTLIVVNVIMTATAFLVLFKPFLSFHNKQKTEAKRIESHLGLWVPIVLLGLGSLFIPIFFIEWLQNYILTPASMAINPSGKIIDIMLWQGINKPFIISVLTIVVGLGIYKLYPPIQKTLAKYLSLLPSGTNIYMLCMNAVLAIAKLQNKLIQKKPLGSYALLFFLCFAILMGYQLNISDYSLNTLNLNFYEIAIALLLILAAFTCLVTNSHLLAITALGVAGFVTTLVFMIYSSPDVAKTQLLVETLVVVFLCLIIRHLPSLKTVAQHSRKRRLLHFLMAGIIGISITILLIQITSSPMNDSLSQFYADNSVPGGHGRNIVNVILVDFRAFDTLGEIVVVLIASIAGISLLKNMKQKVNS